MEMYYKYNMCEESPLHRMGERLVQWLRRNILFDDDCVPTAPSAGSWMDESNDEEDDLD
jgi:hypothetical protein